MERKKNVRWTDDEKIQLCDYLVGKDVTFWDDHFLVDTRSAQEALFTEDRRKVIVGRDNVKELEKAMEEADARHKARTRAREEAAQREHDERIAEERRLEQERKDAAEAEERDRLQAEEDAARAEALLAVQRSHPLDKAMETLAQELVGRFFYHLKLAFDKESQTMFESMGDAVPAFKQLAAVRRRKIMVIGLKPQQQTEIAREYGEKFDFKMVDYLAPLNDVKQGIGSQEAVLAMVDFVGHKFTDNIKRHPGFIPVTGHLKNLRHTLNALMNRV